MNCRPGDFAYVIRARDPRVLGRIVQVLEWIDCDVAGRSGWAVDFVSVPAGLTENWHLHACPDDRLRPISGLSRWSDRKEKVRA